MGRKSTPVALKLVTQTRDKHGKVTPERFKDLVKAKPGIPDHPNELAPDALEEWNRIVGPLYNLGVMTKYDRAILALHCQAWGRWLVAERGIAEQGLMIKRKGGTMMVNPLVAVASKAGQECAKYAAELGLTPSARSRINTTGLNARAAEQAEPREEFEDIFG